VQDSQEYPICACPDRKHFIVLKEDQALAHLDEGVHATRYQTSHAGAVQYVQRYRVAGKRMLKKSVTSTRALKVARMIRML
jgi:predicted nucleic acid-binding Zn finger protein